MLLSRGGKLDGKIRDRLIIAIQNYGSSERARNFDTEDMTDYLMEIIAELKELKRPMGSKVRILLDIGDSFWSWNEEMLEDTQQMLPNSF